MQEQHTAEIPPGFALAAAEGGLMNPDFATAAAELARREPGDLGARAALRWFYAKRYFLSTMTPEAKVATSTILDRQFGPSAPWLEETCEAYFAATDPVILAAFGEVLARPLEAGEVVASPGRKTGRAPTATSKPKRKRPAPAPASSLDATEDGEFYANFGPSTDKKKRVPVAAAKGRGRRAITSV